jgi:hypothetical protein
MVIDNDCKATSAGGIPEGIILLVVDTDKATSAGGIPEGIILWWNP